MGVSLERVQFKFASIIGELCSDPDVLSQFAVWLDLRLAEYKLKGAISLDCSGEEPDPIWLKGLNKSQKKHLDSANKRTDRRIQGSSPTRSRGPATNRSGPQSPAGDRSLSHGQEMSDLAEQHSPDIVVIKDEPSDIQVYPVSLHSHANTNAQFSESHKRTAAESFLNSSGNDHWSHDSSPQGIKRRRGVSTADSPSNQSLMSVIGVSDDLQTSSIKGDNSVLSSSSVPLNSSSMAARSSMDLQGDISADFTDASLNNSQDTGYLAHSGTSHETDTANDDRPRLPCSICGREFTLRKNLQRHMKMHEPTNSPSLQRCSVCGKAFTRTDSYKNHISRCAEYDQL